MNGRACKSGTAYRSDPILNTATCFTIDHVESDGVDNDPFELEHPYICAASGMEAKCRYYYGLEEHIEGKCECGLDGSAGYCLFGDKDDILNYYASISPCLLYTSPSPRD